MSAHHEKYGMPKRARWAAEGRSSQCGRPPSEGKKLCAIHVVQARQRSRERRALARPVDREYLSPVDPAAIEAREKAAQDALGRRIR